jgi:DNA-binding response OmpR family regulator
LIESIIDAVKYYDYDCVQPRIVELFGWKDQNQRVSFAMATILCIEDDAEFRSILVDELRSAGHEMIEAKDGAEGLAAIEKFRPDLVVCDIRMPAMGGFEVLSRTRANWLVHSDMPFIFLTGSAARKDVRAAVTEGVDAYVVKPVDFPALVQRINAQLAGNRSFRRRSKLRKIITPPIEPDSSARNGYWTRSSNLTDESHG